jgi:hypothetical protein
MGAWGVGIFDNDDAMDWVAELERSDDLKAAIEQALVAANQPSDIYLQAPEASTGLAAAEVVAALKDAPSAALPKEIQNWLAKHTLDVSDVISLARNATDRIKSKSELRDLFEESGSISEWIRGIEDLRRRLG